MEKCSWCVGDPLMEAYHDEEWGFRKERDDDLFELLTLEIFQAGLSWRTILLRREAFRKAFRGFDLVKVARFGEADVQRLLADAAIIRNRLKITSTIENARIVRSLRKEHGSFRAWLDSLPPGDLANYQKTFRETFKFCGPEITRMFVMALGMIEAPHEPDCRRAAKSA